MHTQSQLLQNQSKGKSQLLRLSMWRKLIYLLYKYVDLLDRQVGERKFDEFDVFKDDFPLNAIHFAVTPWIKDTRDNTYHRRIDLQYISQISTQDKNVKLYW